MNELPIWQLLLGCAVAYLAVGPVLMAWRWPVMPKREWTEEDELDFIENQERRKK